MKIRENYSTNSNAHSAFCKTELSMSSVLWKKKKKKPHGFEITNVISLKKGKNQRKTVRFFQSVWQFSFMKAINRQSLPRDELRIQRKLRLST